MEHKLLRRKESEMKISKGGRQLWKSYANKKSENNAFTGTEWIFLKIYVFKKKDKCI